MKSYFAKYDYWKYLRGLTIEQNKFLKTKIGERTKPPFYCHEVFPYFMGIEFGPWNPNRLISTFC